MARSRKRKRDTPTPKAVSALPDEISEAEEDVAIEVYVVDSIVDVKDEDTDEPSYEVKWEGYEETTCEPAANITPNLIKAFMKQREQGSHSQKTKRAKRRSDEFDIEELNVKNEDTEELSYEVKWKGYKDATWEPASNLPAHMIQAFMRMRKLGPTTTTTAAEHSDHTVGGLRCPACDDSVDKSASCCERCKRLMHHFCAHDVCAQVRPMDAAGVVMSEFPNDVCYCSVECYTNRHRPTRQMAATHYLHVSSDSDAPTRSKAKERRLSYEYVGSDTDGDSESRETDSQKPTRATKKKPTSAPKKPRPRASAPEPTRDTSHLTSKRKLPPRTIDVGSHVGKTVAFCADQENWMPDRDYKSVKDLFLSGRVFLAKKKVGTSADREKIYEIRWGYTQFQGKRYVHLVHADKVSRGPQLRNTLGRRAQERELVINVQRSAWRRVERQQKH